MSPKKFLVTGGAGFIGSHLCERLLAQGHQVWCIDNFDPYYDPSIKKQNLSRSMEQDGFQFVEADFTQADGHWQSALRGQSFDAILHLAARAGVRPSIQQADAYYRTNVLGTLGLLEFARQENIPRFVFASSSSVYGNNPNVPWSEDDRSGNPISPYASSKLAAEELGLVYQHLYGLRFIALRLFTVFGPRQRPDLAIHKFYELIRQGKSILLYGDGQTRRDYTYVSDIVDGFVAAIDYPGTESVFNLGDSSPVSLLTLISSLEEAMQTKATLQFGPMQEGDVDQTFANINRAGQALGYAPKISLDKGLEAFVQWKTQTGNPAAILK